MASQDFRAWERLCKKNVEGNRTPPYEPIFLRQLPAERSPGLRGRSTRSNPEKHLSTGSQCPPLLPRPVRRCVRACVGVCVRARADAQVAGKPPLPPLGLPVSQRASGPPNGRGRRKMAAAANSGSSLPLFDCPTW